MAQLFLEQALNGLQFGLMLFLLAAGLTLVFGIMDCINLAHGSLYMVGAYFVAASAQAADSFWLWLLAGIAGTALLGLTTGQSIDWPGQGGKTHRLTVTAIHYQPEAAGDLHR